MIKDIQAGYLVSSYFKDIYLYLAQNKLPSNKSAIKKIEVLAEKYILLVLKNSCDLWNSTLVVVED